MNEEVIKRSKEGVYINYNKSTKDYELIIPARLWYWGGENDNYPVIVNRSKDKSYIKKKMKLLLTKD
jgi:hypothetical protein